MADDNSANLRALEVLMDEFFSPSTFQVIAVNSTDPMADDDKDLESDNEASTTRVDLTVAGSLKTVDLKECQAQLHHLMIKIHHSDLVQ